MNTAYVGKQQRRDLSPRQPQSAALDYASPGVRFKPPCDFRGALRQATFAVGVGLLVFGETVAWGNNRGWSDNIGAWAGIGAGLIAWMVPWPGRLGRKRDMER